MIRVGEQLLSAPRVFINVGARPAVPDLPGLQTIPCLTSSSILRLDFVPKHLVIIGGSYVGLEFGQMFRRFGAKVTIIEKNARLLEFEDADVSEALRHPPKSMLGQPTLVTFVSFGVRSRRINEKSRNLVSRATYSAFDRADRATAHLGDLFVRITGSYNQHQRGTLFR